MYLFNLSNYFIIVSQLCVYCLCVYHPDALLSRRLNSAPVYHQLSFAYLIVAFSSPSITPSLPGDYPVSEMTSNRINIVRGLPPSSPILDVSTMQRQSEHPWVVNMFGQSRATGRSYSLLQTIFSWRFKRCSPNPPVFGPIRHLDLELRALLELAPLFTELNWTININHLITFNWQPDIHTIGFMEHV